jgi:hypothetical protein
MRIVIHTAITSPSRFDTFLVSSSGSTHGNLFFNAWFKQLPDDDTRNMSKHVEVVVVMGITIHILVHMVCYTVDVI